MTFSRNSLLKCAIPFFVLATTAAAQLGQAPQCSASAATVPSLRLNGIAETIGDVIVTCTGGTPTGLNQPVPGFNFTLSSSTPISSRLLAPNWSEALLLVDEPNSAAQLVCTASNGACTSQGTGTGVQTYDGSTGHPNVFQAQQISTSALTYQSIPFDPPGPNAVRTFRFTNIRVNSSALVTSAPVAITVSITGSVTIAVSPSQPTVGIVSPPLSVVSKNVQTGANGLAQFTLSFAESNSATFKTRTTSVDFGNSPAPVNQNTSPYQYLGTETHFFNSGLPSISGRGNLGLAGLADSGTRLIVIFTGIPQGITFFTNTSVNLSPTSGVMRLVSTNSNGAGPYQAALSGTLQPDTAGNITAVYEILADDPQTLEHADIPFTISYSSAASPLQSISATAGLAPLTNITTADFIAPLPRYANLTSLSISTLYITPSSLPQGSVGTPYAVLFSPGGGTGPYNWSATGLPSGFSITSSGILSGTPTVASSSPVTVTVTDSTQSTASIPLQLTIANGFIITTTAIPNGTVGAPYSTVIQSAGSTGTVTFTVAPSTIFGQSILPPGLVLAPDGTLSGTPITQGNYTFTVTAQDQGVHQSSQTYKVTIVPALVLTTVSPLPTSTAGAGQLQVAFSAQGGTQPYTFTLVGTPPPGLILTSNGVLTGSPTATGTFTFSVTVTDAQQVKETKPYQITFTAAPSLLQVSSTQLNFSSFFQGDSPAPQTLAITSSSTTPVNYSVQLDSGASNPTTPRWLTVKPTQGVTPAGLLVSVDQSSLVVGIADARILLNIPGDTTRTPVIINVHLDVAAAPPVLDVSPTFLRVRARAAAPGVQTQVLLVRNAGGGGPTPYSVSLQTQVPWITSATSGGGPGSLLGLLRTTLNQDNPVIVTFNTQNLKPGTYRDNLLFTGTNGLITVPIDLYVADSGPYLAVDTRGLRFQARQGAGSSYPQTVRILNEGDPSSTVNWNASLISGSEWLTLSTTRGTSTTLQPGTLVLTPAQGAVSLPAGPHYALIQITDQLSLNSPQYVVAVLDIAPAATPPLPELSTGFLYLTANQGSAPPAGGTVRVYTSSLAPVNFQVAAATADGGTWLQANPTSSSASTNAPGQVTVVVNPSGLPAGIYKGQINIAMSGVLRTKDVTLVVLAAGSVAQPEISGAGPRDASCVASKLALTLGNLTTSFDLPAQFPALISVQLTDNCSSPVPNASVVAQFSNGDPPLTLASDGTGNIYTESWQPGVVQPNMSVTIQAITSTLLQASLVLTGSVEPNVAPVLNRGGTVNNSNVQLDAPLAPGTVTALYGANLATQTLQPGVLPLLNNINGSFVLIGGIQLPLYYASPGQINAQLPVELPVNRPQSVIVGNNGSYSLPDTINITDVSPGVAAYATGGLIAQHSDFSLVDAVHPAHPGEVLVMYLVGMGATNPSTPTGQQTPGQLEPTVIQPTVTVDSQPATVSYAGLTPGGIGLYQINFQVPSSVQSGNLNVVVTQNTTAANTTTLPVAK